MNGWKYDMTESEKNDFWKKVARDNAVRAAADVLNWRSENAKKVIKGIQDSIKHHGFGELGNPTIVLLADELARLVRLPNPNVDCPQPVVADADAAA